MKPVLIRPSADRDMDDIFAWVAADNPAAAERLVARIFDAAKGLARFPEKGRQRPEIGEASRSLVVGRYLILYRVRPDSVDILRIVHGARDLDGLLDSDPGE